MQDKGKKNVIVISCGGTGGHLAPGLAVGEQLSAHPEITVIYLVNDKAVSRHFLSQANAEVRSVPEIEYSKIKSGAFFHVLVSLVRNLAVIFKLFWDYRVVHIVSAGGGAGILPVLLSRLFFVQASLLEQNAVMGQANRFLLRWTKQIFLTFPCINVESSHRFKITGNPVRESLTASVLSKKEAAQRLKLKDDLFTLLIMGGSQGSKRLNEFVLQIMKKIVPLKKSFQVIHLAGKHLLQECRTLYSQGGIPFYCEEFCEDMSSVYTLADFALSRSGGGGIAELLIFGIPAVFVPFPYAAEDHQLANARWVEKNGCGWLIQEAELVTPAGQEIFLNLLGDQQSREACRIKQKQFARPSAAEEIAQAILKDTPW
jgi:UDP-N-acetylglucosamine--N-acetylmuramyl-(pentapeptide) pyrophosphoryl-undecaprenol N-acetylglucosamine transferase